MESENNNLLFSTNTNRNKTSSFICSRQHIFYSLDSRNIPLTFSVIKDFFTNRSTFNFNHNNTKKHPLNNFLLALSNSSPPVRTSDKSDSANAEVFNKDLKEFQK